MNSVLFFNWGVDSEKAKIERLKRRQKESDDIYKESLNPPIEDVIYYKKTDGFWYKEVHNYPYHDNTVNVIPNADFGYLRHLNKDELVELKLNKYTYSVNLIGCSNLKVIDASIFIAGLRISMWNVLNLEKIYLNREYYDKSVVGQFPFNGLDGKFLLISDDGNNGSYGIGYISGLRNKNVKGVNILTK